MNTHEILFNNIMQQVAITPQKQTLRNLLKNYISLTISILTNYFTFKDKMVLASLLAVCFLAANMYTSSTANAAPTEELLYAFAYEIGE